MTLVRPPILPGLALLAGLWVSTAAGAQSTRGVQEEIFFINTRVPSLCLLGEAGDAEGVFDMGVLTEPSTGLLRRDLAAPDKRIVASFCNGPSQLSIEATQMVPADGASGNRDGFARAVHYTATASGWTDEPAVFDTNGPDVQPAAIRLQPRPQEADIIIGVSEFEMPGGSAIRPIASRRYEGLVTLTLAPQP